MYAFRLRMRPRGVRLVSRDDAPQELGEYSRVAGGGRLRAAQVYDPGGSKSSVLALQV
jgi:hypothetical protein